MRRLSHEREYQMGHQLKTSSPLKIPSIYVRQPFGCGVLPRPPQVSAYKDGGLGGRRRSRTCPTGRLSTRCCRWLSSASESPGHSSTERALVRCCDAESLFMAQRGHGIEARRSAGRPPGCEESHPEHHENHSGNRDWIVRLQPIQHRRHVAG